MVWPDFRLGKSGQEGVAEGLGPWQGCLLGRGRSAVSLPRIPRGPQRSEQEKKSDLKETKVRQGALDLRCPERDGGPGTQGGEAHGER